LVAARSSHETLEVGPLEILPAQYIARAAGRTVVLSITELSVLVELARRVDRIVPREELFRVAWGRAMRPGDRSVDVYVRRLRVKLERAVPEWQFIHTHFGLGYRMSPELSRRPQMDEPKGPDPSGLASRSRRTK
jgi:two-component system alkaline phosphatase synthesis response regulator PhoP